jgi:integrase
MPLELKGTHPRPGEVDTRYYMIRVQHAGRRVVLSSGTRKPKEAAAKEQLILDALRTNPNVPKEALVALITGNGSARHRAAVKASEGLTLREAFDRCLKSPSVWGGAKTASWYARNADTICGILGEDTPLAAVDYHAIQRLTETLASKKVRKKGQLVSVAGATVCNNLAALRRVFNVALEEGWPEAPRAFPKVKGVKKRKGREYFMSPADEVAIFGAVLALDHEPKSRYGGPPRKKDGHRYHKLFTALVESGMRLSECLELRWAEIDFPAPGTPDDAEYQGMVELFRAEALKTGRRRSVPMTLTMRKTLEACRGVKGGPFADLNDDRAQDVWEAARDRAGITHRDCVIHSLRHTCASRLLKSGVDLKIVKEWLGHSAISTTDIYTHLDTEQLTGAARNLHRLRNKRAA